MRAGLLKRLKDLEINALLRKLEAMSNEELASEFTRMDEERRIALGLPNDVPFEERVRAACEEAGLC